MSRKTKVHQLGDGGRKCDAKLRVIANGDTDVNVVRAERCDALSVATTYHLKERSFSMRKVEAVEAARLESGDLLGRRAKPVRPPVLGKVRTVTSDIYANVFISKHRAESLPKALQVEETAKIGTLSTAKVPLSKLKKLAADPLVRQVALGQGLRDPNPVISAGKFSNPGPFRLHGLRNTPLR